MDKSQSAKGRNLIHSQDIPIPKFLADSGQNQPSTILLNNRTEKISCRGFLVSGRNISFFVNQKYWVLCSKYPASGKINEFNTNSLRSNLILVFQSCLSLASDIFSSGEGIIEKHSTSYVSNVDVNFARQHQGKHKAGRKSNSLLSLIELMPNMQQKLPLHVSDRVKPRGCQRLQRQRNVILYHFPST